MHKCTNSGVLRTETVETPTHNYFGSYRHVIITRKVAHASKNICVMIMSVYVHIIMCVYTSYEHCGIIMRFD